MHHIGRFLAALRTYEGVSQKRLAKAAERRPEWVTRREDGRVVTAPQVQRYITALDTCVVERVSFVCPSCEAAKPPEFRKTVVHPVYCNRHMEEAGNV